MQHRRMVLAAELPADLRKRSSGELLDDIHGHLARKGDRTRVTADLEILLPQVEVLADALLDQVDGDALFLRSNDVPQHLLRCRQRTRRARQRGLSGRAPPFSAEWQSWSRGPAAGCPQSIPIQTATAAALRWS